MRYEIRVMKHVDGTQVSLWRFDGMRFSCINTGLRIDNLSDALLWANGMQIGLKSLGHDVSVEVR